MLLAKILAVFIATVISVDGRYLGAGHWHPETCGSKKTAMVNQVSEMKVDTLGEIDCTQKDHVPCRVIQDAKTCGNLNYKSNSWPSAPVDLTAVPYRFLDSESDVIREGVKLSWKAPSDDSLRFLKGFEITLITLEGANRNYQTCRLVDLSRSSWKLPDDIFNQQVFEYNNFVGLTRGVCYMIFVTSLPKPPKMEPKQIQTTFTPL